MHLLTRVFMSLFAACCCLAPFPAAAYDMGLPIVFEEYPPYEFVEGGEVMGMNIEIIREAFRRLNIRPFFEPRPWRRALFQLKAGEILALSSGFKTREREQFAIFPDAPLGMETNIIIALAGRKLKVRSLDDLKAYRLGVVRDYAYGEPFDSILGLNKVKSRSSEHLLHMLLEGRIDAAIGNKNVFRYFSNREGVTDRFGIIYEVSSQPLYLMFSRARGAEAEALADDFGAVIKEMVKDGTFQRIVDRY